MYNVYLLILAVSVVLAYLTAWGSRMLDDMFDYGNILDFIRYERAKRAACKSGYHEFEKTAEGILKSAPDFDSRANAMNELYWDVAMKNKGFKLWLCPFCMSVRLSVVFSVIQILFTAAYFGFEIEFLLIPVINAILTYRFVR